MKVVLTTKFTEGGTQMWHVFEELELQGLKPKMLFKEDHDEITFEVPTVEPHTAEWISVKDSRKPKIRERVWVTDCDGEVWIMYYNDCDCYFNEFGDVFADDIIAWQPITVPSPYKGE